MDWTDIEAKINKLDSDHILVVQYLYVSVNDEQNLKSKTLYSGTQQQHKCKNKDD